jgi:multiple sugar transport system substrate-binding protein
MAGDESPSQSGEQPQSPVALWLSRLLVAGLLVFIVVFWGAQIQAGHAHTARKKVRFWHMWTAEWKDVVDKIVDRFNKSQDKYEVEALSAPTQGADSKFILGVMGGDPPDVMAQWNPIIPPWADDNLLRPLDELMTPEEKRAFDENAYPVVKKLGMYRGRLYGMSIGINMFALYYLPQQLRDAGLDPDRFPTTLEELDKWGARLDKRDGSGNLIRLGWGPQGFLTFAPIFGGGIYDWKAGKMTIQSPRNLAALTYLARSRKRLGYENMVRFNAGLDMNSFSGGWPFIGGAFSVTIDGQWRVEQIHKYAPKLEYRTAQIPPPVGGMKLAGNSGGNFMIVPRGAKDPEGAWEFIKFWSGLMNPNTAAEFYTWGGWLPLTPAVAKAPFYQEYLRKFPQFKTFVDLMPSENIEVLPPVPYQEFLADQFTKMEESVLRGTLTPEQGLKELDQAVNAEVKRRKELGYDR